MNQMGSMEVRLETFVRGREDKFSYGVRICFLYKDRGPEIFEKDGFPSEGVALQYGKHMVDGLIKSIPGATAQELG